MDYNIGIIPGDGIGIEVTSESVKVLNKIGLIFNHKFNYIYITAGGASIDEFGVPLTDENLAKAKKCDSLLLGAVGGPKWDNLPNIRPEQALLKLRKELDLFTNLRPATLFEQLKEACPLKAEIIKDGFDILIVRELTGGIYFGESGISKDGQSAYDVESYSKNEIKRVLNVGFQSALIRNKKVTVVDKANILETSRLWRKVANELIEEFPDIELNYMYVDNASMQLIKNPSQFDVIVTSNMFGDILSDEAAMLTGSIGMLPSASLSHNKFGMYEPIHGSAPDIAGMSIANPLASILSVAMMLKYSFDLEEECCAIENAVKEALKNGYRTKDLCSTNYISTSKMGDHILESLK